MFATTVKSSTLQLPPLLYGAKCKTERQKRIELHAVLVISVLFSRAQTSFFLT